MKKDNTHSPEHVVISTQSVDDEDGFYRVIDWIDRKIPVEYTPT
jgi:hypothetical protein